MRARAHRALDHVRRQWIGTLALFLVLTGGTAYALDGQNTVFTDDIVNGDVKVADIGQGAVATDELANGQVKAADIGDGEVKSAEIATGQVTADELAANSVRSDEVADGQVRSQEIANGQVQAADLAPGVAPGASGARAWGFVQFDGTLVRSKQVSSVNTAGNGGFCIDPAPGIDPQTAVMVVSTAFETGRTDATNDDATLAQWDPANTICPATAMQVRTFIIQGAAQTGGELDFGGFDLIGASERFSFVIP